jgi:hypothetical protein
LALEVPLKPSVVLNGLLSDSTEWITDVGRLGSSGATTGDHSSVDCDTRQVLRRNRRWADKQHEQLGSVNTRNGCKAKVGKSESSCVVGSVDQRGNTIVTKEGEELGSL